jgi:hypothetical protein
MNLLPSDLPHPADATSLSKPAANYSEGNLNAVREMLGGGVQALDDEVVRPARFFDLSDEANGLPETVNGAFTRGFQPMLKPSSIKARTSALPIPHDEDFME